MNKERIKSLLRLSISSGDNENEIQWEKLLIKLRGIHIKTVMKIYHRDD